MKDPNRPCPGCGTTDLATFSYRLNRSRTAELRCDRCKECVAKQQRKRNRRSYRREYLYGISEIEYELMLKSQNGNCDICYMPLGNEIHKICVDHDHRLNKNRGIVHKICNTKLAIFENEPFRGQAIAYLEKHSEK